MAFFHASGNSGSINANDFTLVKGSRHMRYSLHKDGYTDIRVVPAIDGNGEVETLIDLSRGQEQYEQLTNAIAFFDYVTYLGPGQANMICPSFDGENKGPVQTFIDTINKKAEKDPKNCDDKWLAWCGKGPGNPRNVMSRPSTIVMVQGYLYAHKGKAILDRDNRPTFRSPVLLCVSRSGTNEFWEKLKTPADENAEWGNNNNQLGDFVDPEHGRILRFTPYRTTFNNNDQTWYHAETTAEVPLSMEAIRDVWRPWDQVVNYRPSLEEVGGWLAKAFDASSVVAVFESHPTYCQCITDSIREIAEREAKGVTARSTVGYQGYGGGYGQGYQPQAQPYPPQPYPPQPQYTPQPPAPQQPQYAAPAPQAPPSMPSFQAPAGIQDDDVEGPGLFDQGQQAEQPQPRQNVELRRTRR